MERKEFIKKSCTVCIGLGAGWMLTELAACAHTPIYRTEIIDHKVSVPLTSFATADLQVISVKGLDYDVAVRKEKENTYSALLLMCTHFDNALNSSGSGYTCSLHGSTYDKNGTVTMGPAEHNLKKYLTSVNETNVIINID